MPTLESIVRVDPKVMSGTPVCVGQAIAALERAGDLLVEHARPAR
jgi:uncharacterized protein (DUF433 family)